MEIGRAPEVRGLRVEWIEVEEVGKAKMRENTFWGKVVCWTLKKG